MHNHYQDDVVKHSVGCYSVNCLLDSGLEHVSVVYFKTATDCYWARSLDAAARMWQADGAKYLENVGRMG